MMTAAQLPPYSPLCAAVCDLWGHDGYCPRQGSLRLFGAVFGAVDFKQDKGLASKPPLCPLTSARSADSFKGGGTGVLSA